MEFLGACAAGDRIVIAAVGDLLFHETLQRQALAPAASYRRFFNSIESVLTGADIAYGNLEGPAAHAVATGGGNARDPGRIVDGRVYGTTPGALIFNYHPSAIADLKASGFKVLSTANNHAVDRGALGVDRTIDALDAAGMAYAGTRRRTDIAGQLGGQWTALTQSKGVRVAWLACTYGTNGMPDRQNQVLHCYRDREVVMDEIRQAAADPAIDAVILTPHWGLEGSMTPLKSDRAYARDAIEAGASAVIGTHPHVLQPWERVETKDGRDGLVIYSTGNFVSNQQSAAQRSGVIALIELVKPAAGRTRIAAVGFIPTWVNKQGSSGHRVIEQTGAAPETAVALKAALRVLPSANRVTAKDFRTLPRHCPTPPPAAPTPDALIIATAERAAREMLPSGSPPPINHRPLLSDGSTVSAEPSVLTASLEISPSSTDTRSRHVSASNYSNDLSLTATVASLPRHQQPQKPDARSERALRSRGSAQREDLGDATTPCNEDDKTHHTGTQSKPKGRRSAKPKRRTAAAPAAKAPAKRKSKHAPAPLPTDQTAGEPARLEPARKRRAPAAKIASSTAKQPATAAPSPKMKTTAVAAKKPRKAAASKSAKQPPNSETT